MKKQFKLNDENATKQLAQQLSKVLCQQVVVYLHGELGAGKTSFVRYFIQALGYQGLVKSPTYTLVEPYQLDTIKIYHYDLYRLKDPEELEFIGIRDYLDTTALHFIEWPEKGKEHLPLSDLDCTIDVDKNSTRVVTLVARTTLGRTILKQIHEA